MLGCVRHTTLPRLLTISLLLASVITLSSDAAGDAATSPPTPPSVQRGATLTSTSAGLGTMIDSVDLLSATFGYGVASNDPYHPTGWVYLVRTSNAGLSWTLRSALPYLSFHQSGGTIIPSIHFVSSRVGYLESGPATPGAIFVTLNGGITWARLATPGITPTFLTNASSLAVVSYLCTHANDDPNDCPDELSLYRVGATSPWRSVPIPRTSNVPNRDAQLFAAPSPGTFVISEGDPGGGGQHSRLSLSLVSDGGEYWRHLDDPCASFGSDQLVTFGSRNWLLSCFLGEGMSQGIGNLYRTSDGGQSWSRILHGDEEATTITPSGNRHLLFGAVGGATGGVVVSSDGGARWTRADVVNGQGGASESLATIGATGAIDVVVGGQTYRTKDGRTWNALPPLPSGSYRGDPICVPRHVKVTLSGKPAKGFQASSLLIFTNDGAQNCYLTGPPNTQSIGGVAKAALGPPSYMDGYNEPRLVVLKAHGGTANARLWISRTKGWSASTCAAAMATGLAVDFGSPADFAVNFRTPLRVCTGLTGLGIIVDAVQPGLKPHD